MTPSEENREERLELPVEELLRRARSLPPHDEMVIEDLGEEESAAFLAASSRELGPPRVPIVIDTDVFSADLVPGSRLAERYASLIAAGPRSSLQTAAGVWARWPSAWPTASLSARSCA